MPSLELKITLDAASGKVEVTGPLLQKIPLVYMLEEAKRLVLNFDPGKPAPPSLVLPAGPLPPANGR